MNGLTGQKLADRLWAEHDRANRLRADVQRARDLILTQQQEKDLYTGLAEQIKAQIDKDAYKSLLDSVPPLLPAPPPVRTTPLRDLFEDLLGRKHK